MNLPDKTEMGLWVKNKNNTKSKTSKTTKQAGELNQAGKCLTYRMEIL